MFWIWSCNPWTNSNSYNKDCYCYSYNYTITNLYRYTYPHTFTPTPVPTLTATTSPENAAASQQKTEKTEQGEDFWNKPMWDGLPKCTTDFGFSHQLVAPKDIMEIMFGPGSHVWPHEHMTYWGVAGEAGGVVQLYAPTDIFRIDLRTGFPLWSWRWSIYWMGRCFLSMWWLHVGAWAYRRTIRCDSIYPRWCRTRMRWWPFRGLSLEYWNLHSGWNTNL